MANEGNFESPNGHSHHNEWESGHAGQLEEEWRQFSAAYTNQGQTPEWENSAYPGPTEPKALPVNKEAQLSRIRRIIAHCRQIALPVTIQVLGEAEEEFPSNPKSSISPLLTEYESIIQSAEAEAAALESETLGESEFNAELQSSEKAYDLALTEVLAAEASHASAESEAQSLLATALPITISIMGPGMSMSLGKVLPQLTQTNARLVGSLFHSGKLSRAALGLLPTIQRRTISSLKTLSNNQQPITPELTRKIFAAHTAKVLTSPSLIGRALTRNQAVRINTMPACTPRR